MLTYFFLHLPLYISEHIKEKQNEHTIHSTTHVQKADESRPWATQGELLFYL